MDMLLGIAGLACFPVGLLGYLNYEAAYEKWKSENPSEHSWGDAQAREDARAAWEDARPAAYRRWAGIGCMLIGIATLMVMESQ